MSRQMLRLNQHCRPDDITSPCLWQFVPDRRSPDPARPAPPPVEAAERPAAIVSMNDAIDRLPPRDRELIMRFYIQSETDPAIADSLNLSVAGVKVARRRAVKVLRLLMAGTHDVRSAYHATRNRPSQPEIERIRDRARIRRRKTVLTAHRRAAAAVKLEVLPNGWRVPGVAEVDARPHRTFWDAKQIAQRIGTQRADYLDALQKYGVPGVRVYLDEKTAAGTEPTAAVLP